jgi:ABC-2 type transport system permease protein
MNAFADTLIMAKRSLRHTVRSVDTIITVAAMPIFMMLLFVFVFGSSFDTGTIKYINFVTPAIVLMTVGSGIAYAAMTKGIINRFRTMPVAPSSILGGHAVSSVISNLVSVALVLIVAVLAGFRSDAGLASCLAFTGLLLLFTVATTWMAIVFGLLAKTAEGAGAFSYILLLLIFVSSGFTPTDKMNSFVRAFAQHQPMTSIIETMRSLLSTGAAGDKVWTAVVSCVVVLIVSYVWALKIYKTKVA